jgi:TfoX/Sxy family transcriptional regulator of competence genes
MQANLEGCGTQMATQRSTVDYILEQAAGAGQMSARAMFGEFALYCDGKVVALICDDQLFVKPTSAGKAAIGSPELGTPFPGAKPFFLVSGDYWEDSDWLAKLIRITADALPMPKPKAPKKPKAPSARSPAVKTSKKSKAAKSKP